MNRQHLMKNGDSFHPSKLDDDDLGSLVEDEDADDDDYQPAYLTQRRRGTSFAISAVLFVVFLVLLLVCAVAVLLVMRAISVASEPELPELLTCGSSPEEARHLGCRFNVMSFTWVPSPCFDEELIDEFLSSPSTPWKWFSEPNSTTASTVPVGEVLSGQFPELYVTNAFHTTHCTFTWKQLHRALAVLGYLDSYIGNYEHTLHCEQMLLSRSLDLAQIETTIRRKFSTCRRITGRR